MRLSPAAELAVRGMIILAGHHGQGPVTLDTICAARDLPKQYLVKLFAMLAHSGLVTPIRGKNGGYTLGRNPSEITLLEIIEAVQGPVILNYCTQNPPQCTHTVKCAVHPMWKEIQHFIRQKLSSMTLDKCAEDVTSNL